MWVAAIKPKPTTPTLTLRVDMLHLDRFSHLTRGADVRDALVASFAFDAAPTIETQLLQRAEKRLPIHLSRSGGNFLTPLAGRFRAIAIFDVALFQPRRERAQRLDRISLIVKDHVRW